MVQGSLLWVALVEWEAWTRRAPEVPFPPQQSCECVRAWGRNAKMLYHSPRFATAERGHRSARFGARIMLKVTLLPPGSSHADPGLCCGSNPAFLVGTHGIAAY